METRVPPNCSLSGDFTGPYWACDVAKYIVEKHSGEISDLSVTKLIKLTYIAHGWFLGATRKLLIEDEVEAWRFGPVMSELYHEVKGSNLEEIKASLQRFVDVKESSIEQNLIKHVVSIYGDLTATRLVNLTHSKSSPWFQTIMARNHVIPSQLIADYYSERFKEYFSKNEHER